VEKTDNGGLTVGGVAINSEDVDVSNGVIHAVDTVLLPPDLVIPDDLTASPDDGSTSAPGGSPTTDGGSDGGTADSPSADSSALEFTESSQDFTVLLEAVKQAGLEDVLSSDGPITIFAPTDAAFDKLSPELLEYILANKDVLVTILQYHVVSGLVTYQDLESESSVTSVSDIDIPVEKTEDGGITVGGVVINPEDVDVSNGVIHSVDTVLLPPDLELPDNLTPPPASPSSPTPAPGDGSDTESPTMAPGASTANRKNGQLFATAILIVAGLMV
jgi:uncharacterized surface protein with fasciclin (FAS1) repeats